MTILLRMADQLRTVTVKTLGIETADGRKWALCVGTKPAFRELIELPDGQGALEIGSLITIRFNGTKWSKL
jgi:hypothetical protein